MNPPNAPSIATAPTTVATALQGATLRLARAGVDTPIVDARLLLVHTLGVTRTSLIAHPDRPLTTEELRRFEALLRRREQREPLPYLLGTWEFMGMALRVSPAALIPRPETEVLVEALAARLAPGALVLDVGTGSGCIALALARLLPGLRVLALDLSEAAVRLAAENARAHGLADRVRFVAGRFPDVLFPGRRFDAIAANPPYIPSAAVDGLQPEVRDHEPRLALDGGRDGLSVLRPLAVIGPWLLNPGGWLATEVQAGQAPEVRKLLEATPSHAPEDPESLAHSPAPDPNAPAPAPRRSRFGVRGSPLLFPNEPQAPSAARTYARRPAAPAWREITNVPDLAGIDRVILARAR